MNATFILPFMLASFWATLGCLFIRKVWRVRYDAILVFWMMTVFAFTFSNRILFLDKMTLIDAMQMASLAFFLPILSHFGYRKILTNFCDSEKYPAIFYGLTLIISATICSFNVLDIVNEVGGLNVDGHFVGLSFFLVLLVQLAVGSLGLFISLRAKSMS